MFKKVLIANRGEIACRVIRTLKRMGIASVAVYSDADRFSAASLAADEAVRLGPAPVAESYLNIDAIIAACRQTGAEAVHPGYGFLSEKPEFAERLASAGIAFIGPAPEHMRAFGLKHTARELALKVGAPLLPGSGLIDDIEAARGAAESIAYPVILKSTAGGGGIGMQVCRSGDELAARFASVQRLAQNNFGDGRLYLEKYVARARHVEVQIFGDGKGGILALGERDCSLQRRHQKVIEETPAPGLSEATRARLFEAAIALGRSVNYKSAGTVEFVYDADAQDFYFLEVNTRLQVEHPVTEAVTGIDLVEWMVREAAGEFALPDPSTITRQGAAIEARLYAEDPAKDFRPTAGRLTDVSFPDGVRVDGWIETGTEVSPYYDPMLAKLIVHVTDRADAIAKLGHAIEATRIWGIETNLAYLAAVIADQAFATGTMTTGTLGSFAFQPRTIDALVPGAQSSLQEFPGRLGFWAVGVPPSGPMDDLSFRLVNKLVGNPEGTAALECTLTGPSLRFNAPALAALGGAEMAATLDGAAVPYWTPFKIATGQTLTLGKIPGPGNRAYLAVRGGFDAPMFLGSRATFSLGGFGGHATGVLRTGDVLRLSAAEPAQPSLAALLADELPPLTRAWEIGVIYGPHGAPDFFQADDITDLFAAEYEVHFNSARTGVRLIGPKPRWARSDGGEAGLHPSNLHDNAYAVGAIDFTGDMPIILGPDGPSLGGFVCPAVVARSELWKTGQLKPGDKVRFRPLTVDEAVARHKESRAPLPHPAKPPAPESAIAGALRDREVPVVYRVSGDDYLLIEYGSMVLDIALRLRVELLAAAVKQAGLPGIVDLTPGIRSLQIHYDSDALSLARLIDALEKLEASLPSIEDVEIPSRIVHLPLSWNDDQAQLAMRKYQELVRPNAPWCPSNIEFIRRINGLESIEAVKQIIFDASYLVLGLGDVYLGAPVATPIDPRHRLVTTKYNPARTWTPENAVGIGGAYLCIYGMEGPGGYQLFGRTVQVWNSWRATELFEPGSPWLLRFFDQIRFFPVSAEELLDARAALPHGRYPIRIEEARFNYADYKRFLTDNAAGIAAFKTRQQASFEAERQAWIAAGLDSFVVDDGGADPLAGGALPDGMVAVESPVPGNVWKVLVAPGDAVAAGQAVAIVESMKMEISIEAPVAGRVSEIRCQPGREVRSGQMVAILKEE
jgi:urea carboxylase